MRLRSSQIILFIPSHAILFPGHNRVVYLRSSEKAVFSMWIYSDIFRHSDMLYVSVDYAHVQKFTTHRCENKWNELPQTSGD